MGVLPVAEVFSYSWLSTTLVQSQRFGHFGLQAEQILMQYKCGHSEMEFVYNTNVGRKVVFSLASSFVAQSSVTTDVHLHLLMGQFPLIKEG